MKDLTAGKLSPAYLTADEVLKLTSLLYLKDALETQRFEECGQLIASAKQFGATQSEVSAVLAQFGRGGARNPGYGADQSLNSRF